MNQHLPFFGTLHEILSLSEKALREVRTLWDEGNIRMKEDDLKLMNEVISKIQGNVRKIKSYNHTRFGVCTNSFVDKVEKLKRNAK